MTHGDFIYFFQTENWTHSQFKKQISCHSVKAPCVLHAKIYSLEEFKSTTVLTVKHTVEQI